MKSKKHFIGLTIATSILMGGLYSATAASVSVPPVNFLLLKKQDNTGMVYREEQKPFYHGVASGDPLADKVIIWTRVTPEAPMATISVDWEMATDETFSNIIKSGTTSTEQSKDYTVKVDVDSLAAGTTYYYRFKALGKTSMVGRTKTTPTGEVDEIKIGVVTGSNYQWGYFNAYESMAARDDLNAFIHTGDYIYEYKAGKYAHPDLEKREHFPDKDLLILDDYRKRYSQYRLTMPLQNLHKAMPMIAQWDDHEFANDTWREGAENHDPATQGEWQARRDAALQAYYEWMPVRVPASGDLKARYQKISYGNLLDLFMIEARMNRDEQLCSKGETNCTIDENELYRNDRTILGTDQKNWLLANLTSSTANWKLISSSVMFSQLYTTDQYGNMDSWDGYPIERETIYGAVAQAGITNFGTISGDYHTAFASQLVPLAQLQNYWQTGEGAIGFEFTTPSITTANFNEQEEYTLPDGTTIYPLAMRLPERSPYALGLEDYVKQNLNHIKYVNVDQHGYMVVTAKKDKMTTTWYYNSNILQKDNLNEVFGASWSVPAGTSRMQEEGDKTIQLQHSSSWASGKFDEGAAEIVAHENNKLFVTNSGDNQIEILTVDAQANISHSSTIDLSPYGAGPNSVAVNNGVLAVAVESDPKQDNGKVVFFNTNDNSHIKTVTVGSLPDMLVFTPDGSKVLVANEGEPNDDYDNDPEGSISIIDISGGVAQAAVTTADFTSFNSQETELKSKGVRIFGPNATVAQDLEPEYITVSTDSTTAWITLQENNAIARLDINSATISDIFSLGYQEHGAYNKGMDASDKDDKINIKRWPDLYGMYQPDSISSFAINGTTYLITANEGDARDYDGFAEEERVEDIDLDATAFPDADDLQKKENLGRLTITTTMGDTDNDGDYDKLYSFGSRSFSIWKEENSELVQVYDSGDMFEKITASVYPQHFNSNGDDNDSFESRSDNKGPEPEGVAHGEIEGRHYAFIGLERMGGIMVFDITEPEKAVFVQYINNRNFNVDADDPQAGDLSPEGVTFISASDSPSGKPLLAVANEVSGTVSLFTIETIDR